jgi:hypothetical protein
MLLRNTLFGLVTLLLGIWLLPAQAARSTIEDGYLFVPRIDLDGYGAMALSFRIVFEDEYRLLLESAEQTSLGVSNSGAFDATTQIMEIDEVQLESGQVYSVRLGMVSDFGQATFAILEATELTGEPVSPTPTPPPSPGGNIDTAAEAVYNQQCAGCHALDGAGTAVGPALTACANCGTMSGLTSYIRDTMPLGQATRCDLACASDMADYILAAFNSANEEVANQTVGFIALLGNSESLRRAAMELGSRLPTLAEYQMISERGEAGLRAAIAGMLEQDAFYERLTEIWNDYLLTDKYHSRNGAEDAIRLLSSDDFPNRRWFDPSSGDKPENYEEVRRHANNGVAREPLALINYVVRNDHPFTEILTADYMMVNPFSVHTYGIPGVAFSDPDDPDEFQPGKLEDVPHAGILTSPMFLNRYPTTSTNRNRGRARVVFDLFLDTDILAIEGVRPGNAVDITTPIPTINNPECSKCHSILDPVASVFQNWDYKGRYRPARLTRSGWYTDMEARGFNGEPMPLAGNVDSSVQWLAQKMAADPKFPRAVTRIMVNGLTGKEPLDAPVDDGASQADRDAYIAERTLLNSIQDNFVASGYNLKVLVQEILLSPYWRAGGLTVGANVEAHELTGATYLLTPEQLDRKIEALLGFDWRGSMDNYYKDKDRSWASKLGNTFHQIYGGIDSDGIITRLRTPNGLMGAMQLRMANELSCYAVPHDLWLPAEQRRLFVYVDHESSPYSDTGYLDETAMAAIRQNIQYLHNYLLGENLALDSAELRFTEQLFMDSINRGRQLILNSGGEWSAVRLPGSCDRTRDLEGESLEDDERLQKDSQYVIRAWMAVVAYLLSDYRFVYN